MRRTSLDYLEALKIEEVMAQLQADGYKVQAPASGADNSYDLIATRGDQKIAIEVKAGSRLKASSDTIRQLRHKAHEQGFDEFRLVVVAPPSPFQGTVEAFEEKLREYLFAHVLEVADLPPGTVLRDVSDVDLNTVEVGPQQVRVSGTGIVDVVLNGEQTTLTREPELMWAADFPFRFDASLDRDLHIQRCDVQVDTSSLREEIEVLAAFGATA